MAIDIELPSYSPSMEEADLIGWLVAPGDYVNEGDPIAEIETDKATGELEAPASGTLIEICVPEGTTGVKVGTVVARLEGAAASATAARAAISCSIPTCRRPARCPPTPAAARFPWASRGSAAAAST